jgi:hypothetical protein
MVMPSQVSVDDTCKCFFECTAGNHGQGTLYHPNLLWANSFKYGNKSFGGVCAFFHKWKGQSLLSWPFVQVVYVQKVQ